MAREKLTGYYGTLAKAADTPVTTGLLKAGVKYIATTIGGTSTLPTGAEAGYGFVADGTEDITSSGDEVLELVETEQCDISSWSIDMTKDESEVTTLCDIFKVFLEGRTDLSGSLEGVFKIGTTDEDGGFANGFVDIVSQAGNGGEVTINKIDGSQIVLLLYKQKDQSSGETELLYIAPVTVLSFSDGVNGTDAQAFSSTFRIAPNDDIIFHMFEVLIA